MQGGVEDECRDGHLSAQGWVEDECRGGHFECAGQG